nr:hypothetical protein Iba_chr11dCG1580 [Ipomoea batatas]GME01194.1 hypothetical protein Iba_scaffold1676984CG0010 [Ipomoea batatas]
MSMSKFKCCYPEGPNICSEIIPMQLLHNFRSHPEWRSNKSIS